MTSSVSMLPEWSVTQWFNAPNPLSLSDLRGKVVVIEAFQMLCPGCVAHGLPLAQQVHDTFSKDDVAVIGLHCVFEHHAAMEPVSLAAFLHEYRISFPVAVDTPGPGTLPVTMDRYGLRGTPSMLVVDRDGGLAAHSFGQISALALGAKIQSLIDTDHASVPVPDPRVTSGCDETGCAIP